MGGDRNAVQSLVGEKDGEGETNRERLMRGEDGVVF